MRVVPAVVLLLWPGVVTAQRLTIDEAVAAALRQHPAVVRAEAELQRAGAASSEAAAALWPWTSVDGVLMRYQEPMVVAPLHGFDPARPPQFDRTLAQASVGLSYTLVDGGGRRARIGGSAALAAAAAAGLEDARAAVVAETAGRYAAVLVAREIALAHRTRESALELERDRSAQLFEQGRAARVVVLRAEAALSAARAELEDALLQLALAERELARSMGVAAERVSALELTPVRLRAELPVRELAAAQSAESGAGIGRLRQAAAAAGAAVAQAEAERWPQLQFGGRYVQYGSGAGHTSGEWQTGVQLSYRLFTGGARPAAAEAARAAWRMAQADVALAQQRLAEASDRAHAGVTSARARAAAWQAAVAQSEEVVRIERLSLDTGVGVQTDYLAAEAELLRLRAALSQARYAELSAHLELARAMGQLTPEWLTRNLESDS